MNKHIEIMRLKQMSKEIGEIADKLLTEYQTPIETLNLSSRLRNALHRGGVEYVEQVLTMTEKDFMRLRNFGKCCLIELTERIKIL